MPSNSIRLVAVFLLSLSTSVALAGSIDLSWTSSPGATGYRVYYGDEPGVYDQFIDVGPALDARLTGLADCRNWYLAVKSYNVAGEATTYSNEVVGWPRPAVSHYASGEVMQGRQFTLEITGNNFQNGAQLVLDPSPTDIYGNPLFRLDGVDVLSCTRIEAHFTVEATTPGNRAMEAGLFDAGIEVENPGRVYKAREMTFDVLFNPDRWDLNQSEAGTVDRVDGSDLTWLAFAFGNVEGDERYSADADLDGDGLVDGEDLALLAAGFGLCWSGSDWTAAACA